LVIASFSLVGPVIACAAGGSQGPPSKPARSEKESRTPAQQKINSQILYEIYRARGEAQDKQVPPGPTGVRLDDKDRALVDIRVAVTPAIERKVRDAGGTIVSTSREYRSIIAWVPVLRLERLAEDASVRAVEPAAEATTRQ
jgi:hypothetical protein